jgi:ribosomal protein S17E
MARFPSKFNTSFDENKFSVDELTNGATTRIRNQTAGYITRTLSLAQANSATESEFEEQEETAD